MKHFFDNKKIFIASLVCLIIILGTIGITSGVAQPTLEDQIYNRVYGTFTPVNFYDDEEADVSNWKVVGSLHTTDIIVDYSVWSDFNGDGFIDLNDVYSQEDYQFKFLMNTHTLPILDTGDGGYYMVKLSHFSQVDQVIASIYLSNNNDKADIKELTQYFYDRDTHILYLAPGLMYEIDHGVELKSQTVAIVHNIDDFTKEFAVASAVNPELGATALEGRLPNGIQRRSFKRWMMDGLDIPLIPAEYLAHVAASDIKVYVNERVYTNWQYNETTGILSFPEATPDDVNNIAIYIEDVQEVSFVDSMLQYAQNQWGSTARAITFEDLPENRLCQHITYTTAPQLGAKEALDFYAFVYQTIPKGTTEFEFNLDSLQITGLTVFENALGAVSREDILRAIKSVYSNGKVTVDPSTGATDMANDVLSMWTPVNAESMNAENLFNQLHLQQSSSYETNGVTTYYLDSVYAALGELQIYSSENSGQLLSSWQYWTEGSKYTDAETAIGMYVVGKSNSTNKLLGGTVDKGFPYFTVTSCNIQIPENPEKYNPIPTVDKKDSHQTVISIVGKTDKHLYICIAPLALKEDNSVAYERLCGFTKIRYTYVGRGNITFIKTDVHQAWLGGAEYEIYKATKNGGSITNATLVDYYDYFNDTDYVPKEDAQPQGNTITTSGIAAVKISLPYVHGDEVYFFREKTPPVGYLRDNTDWFFYVNEAQPETSVVASDIKQNGIITWHVYDATTRSTPTSPRTEVGLAGIPFTLVDESGLPAVRYDDSDRVIMTYERMVTDYSGTIVFNVRPGTYYVRQLDTIENYYMDNHPKDSIEVPLDENCNYFKIVVEADRTGEHIPLEYSHYEKRQEVRIQSQVYDERIGNKTPPHLGGIGAGEVETQNSEWELYVLGSSQLLVGYKTDGTPVRINNASGPLHVDSIYEQRTASKTVYAYPGGGANNPGTSNKLTYISATHVWIDNVRYPLPNGTYYWKLKQASKGYVTTENRKTDLDAKWIEENKEEALKIVMDTADESILSYVVMDRQQSNMTVYSKAYEKTVVAGAFNYLDVVTQYSAYKWDDTIGIFDKINYTIVTDSTHSQIQPASVEKIVYAGDRNAELYAKKFSMYNSTQTNGTANLINGLRPHAVYQLQNITDIVSMDGGVIPANTILGRYISDDDGYIFIDSFGSNLINNPNVTSQDLNITFEKVSVVDTLGRGVDGTELPNGDYILSVIMAPDEHEIEDMFENTPIYQTWTKEDSVQNILKKVNTIPFYHARNTIGPNKVDNVNIENAGTYLAPSPIDDTPADPYDPRNPDEPDVSPDDSNDIPCPDNLAWIIRHRNDRTYRTVDRNNFAETQDIVPTTMTMAYTDSTITDWDSKYELYMFYEITANEYDAAKAAYLAAGYSQNDWERNWEYRRQAFGGDIIYFRRFAITANGTSAILTQNIAFNQTTNAWLGYDEIKRNETLSAAIDNTSWINMKLAETEFQGAYHIGFGVLTIRETQNPLSHVTLRKEEFSDSLAILAIRNRQLFNLD